MKTILTLALGFWAASAGAAMNPAVFDSEGNLLMPASVFHANLLAGTNVTISTNGGKLTLHAVTDTNVVRALMGAGIGRGTGPGGFPGEGGKAGFDPRLATNYSGLSWQVGENRRFNMTLGQDAGRFVNPTKHEYSTIIGYRAGMYSTNSERPTQIGFEAGLHATDASVSVQLGTAAGQYASNSWGSTLLGYAAGRYAANANHTAIIGLDAARTATNIDRAVMVGSTAGTAADGAVQSVLVGFAAGATNRGPRSVMIGAYAGTGLLPGQASTNDADVVYIGHNAGKAPSVPGATNSIAIGSGARVTGPNQVVIGNAATKSTRLHGVVDAGGVTTNLVLGGVTLCITNGIIQAIR